MKLRTVMRIDGLYTAPIGSDGDMAADSAAAHALMLAVKEHHGRDWIEYRADEILAGWGFDSGEDA